MKNLKKFIKTTKINRIIQHPQDVYNTSIQKVMYLYNIIKILNG